MTNQEAFGRFRDRIGEQLYYIRVGALELIQEEVAELLTFKEQATFPLGVTVSFIEEVETCRYLLTYHEFQAFCRAFSVSELKTLTRMKYVEGINNAGLSEEEIAKLAYDGASYRLYKIRQEEKEE